MKRDTRNDRREAGSGRTRCSPWSLTGFGNWSSTLLPGRQVAGSWDIDDHEEIAGLTCAITALCVGAGQFTAVGADDDGWTSFHPSQLWAVAGPLRWRLAAAARKQASRVRKSSGDLSGS